MCLGEWIDRQTGVKKVHFKSFSLMAKKGDGPRLTPIRYILLINQVSTVRLRRPITHKLAPAVRILFESPTALPIICCAATINASRSNEYRHRFMAFHDMSTAED